MKIDGFSPAQIADKLNKDGVPSPYEYKRLCGSKFQSGFKKQIQTDWSPVAIYRILKNEMYTGTLVQGKTMTPNHKVKVRSKRMNRNGQEQKMLTKRLSLLLLLMLFRSSCWRIQEVLPVKMRYICFLVRYSVQIVRVP